MGKGDNKKSTASSTKAAELLAKIGAGRPSAGFGGLSGSTPVSGFVFGSKYIAQVAPASVESSPTPSGLSPIIPADLDGELAQQLQRLSKRDATTRLKALQSLRMLASEKPKHDIERLLGPWAYSFSKLVMDGNRSVRMEACQVMGAVASAAGRSVAPVLKSVYPYWFLAQHDETNEVVTAAANSIKAVFPSESKAAEALVFCRSEVLNLLDENASSTPQSLGDPRKESPEELQSRYERVLASTCSALGTLIKEAKKMDKSNVREEFNQGVISLLENPTFIKFTLQSKSIGVRRAAYALVTLICKESPNLLTVDDSKLASLLAPSVFGALGEKEASNHPAMWGMLLTFISSHQSAWNDVNMSKSMLPKLYAMLRNGCYGSAEGSYPAILPLLSLMPMDYRQDVEFYKSLLDNIWQGMNHCASSLSAQQAAADCFRECYLFGILKNNEEIFCKELTATAFEIYCMPAALMDHGIVPRKIISDTLSKLSSLPEHQKWKFNSVVEALGRAAAQSTLVALESGPNSPGSPSFTAIGEIVMSNKELSKPVVDVLLHEVRSSNAPPAATGLLASIVKAMPESSSLESEMEEMRLEKSTSFTVDSIINRITSERQTGDALQASCDLVASCLEPKLFGKYLSQLIADTDWYEAASVLARNVLSVSSTTSSMNAKDDDGRLAKICLDIVSNSEKLRTDAYASVLLETIISPGGKPSLIGVDAQSAVLEKLVHAVEHPESEADKTVAMRLINNIALSTSLSANSEHVISAKLLALAAVFEVLVEESCALASLGDEYEAETDEEDLYRMALGLWISPCDRLKPAFAAATLEHQNQFLDSLSHSLADALSSFSNEKACSAAALCAKSVFELCGDNSDALRSFMQYLHINIHDNVFFVDIGELLGFDKMLEYSNSDEERTTVAVELLLHCQSDALEMVINCVISDTTLLKNALEHLSSFDSMKNNEALVCWLLGKALLSASSNAVAVDYFRLHASRDNIKLLHSMVPLLRSNENLLHAAGLPEFSIKMCQEAKLENLNAVAACFPAPIVAPPIPNFAASTNTNSTYFGKGALVWYMHRDGTWEAAEVTTVDVSVDPPSYGVKLASRVRETEQSRLRERKQGDTTPPYSSITSSSTIEDTTIMIVTDEEKEAFLNLFKNATSSQEQEEEKQQEDASILLSSVLGWCWQSLSQSDWEKIFQLLQHSVTTIAEDVGNAAVNVATAVSEAAESLVGAALGSPDASVAFFRQLRHKGVLNNSEKGIEAAKVVYNSVESVLTEFDASHGAVLSLLLNAYCQAAKVSSTSRTCPFIAWESTQASVCADILSIFISLGKIVALASSCGQSAAAHPLKSCWQHLCQVVEATIIAADRAFLIAVVNRANTRIELDGVGCTEALVALALDPEIPESAQNTAYKSILMHTELIWDLVNPALSVAEDEENDEEFVQRLNKSWTEELEAGGVVPDLAYVAAGPSSHPLYLRAWSLLVAYFLNTPESGETRSTLIERIKDAHGLVHRVLDDAVVPQLPFNRNDEEGDVRCFTADDTSGKGFSQNLLMSIDKNQASLVYAGMLRALPVPSRLWYSDLRDKSTAAAVEKYTSTAVTAGLLAAEYAAVDEMSKSLDRFEKFSVRSNAAAREVVASLVIEDGHMVELVVKLPAVMPLRAPEVECRRSVEISQVRLRKWLLSVTAFLRSRNGAVASALLLWKKNLDNEFAGHEDCLICFSVIQPSTGQLPKMACRTCRKRFHGACLHKWFSSSGKSTCPHCQTPW